MNASEPAREAASSAASENVAQDSVTSCLGAKPGSMRPEPAEKVTSAPRASLPVKRLRTSAAAAENVLCPDVYSGNGGVTNVAGWYGTQSSPFTSLTPSNGTVCRTRRPLNRKWIAVIGRSES